MSILSQYIGNTDIIDIDLITRFRVQQLRVAVLISSLDNIRGVYPLKDEDADPPPRLVWRSSNS